jgi:hypothetical protein
VLVLACPSFRTNGHSKANYLLNISPDNPKSASTATIVRIAYIRALEKTWDYSWGGINLTKWSLVEPAIIITAASIATLRPLFQKFLGHGRYDTELSAAVAEIMISRKMETSDAYDNRQIGSDRAVSPAISVLKTASTQQHYESDSDRSSNTPETPSPIMEVTHAHRPSNSSSSSEFYTDQFAEMLGLQSCHVTTVIYADNANRRTTNTRSTISHSSMSNWAPNTVTTPRQAFTAIENACAKVSNRLRRLLHLFDRRSKTTSGGATGENDTNLGGQSGARSTEKIPAIHITRGDSRRSQQQCWREGGREGCE